LHGLANGQKQAVVTRDVIHIGKRNALPEWDENLENQCKNSKPGGKNPWSVFWCAGITQCRHVSVIP